MQMSQLHFLSHMIDYAEEFYINPNPIDQKAKVIKVFFLKKEGA